MRLISLFRLVALSSLASVSSAGKRDYDKNDFYVLHIDPTVDPGQIALRLGFEHEGQLSELTDHHVFRAPKVEIDVVKTERKRRKRDPSGTDILDSVLFAAKQEARMRHVKRGFPPALDHDVVRRDSGLYTRQNSKPDAAAVKAQTELANELEIKDPIFGEQWHLFNTIQLGHDVNVSAVWREGITGKNATVAIVDDGLDMHSQDLKDNYFAEGSWDFNDDDPEPKPELSDDNHGTRCAGEVGAGRNDFCGVGVAYDSRIAGIRILSKPISDADEAEALIYKYQQNQIYSCSWGPPDDGQSMEAPNTVIKRAMVQGIQKGRGGLGSIYVFASGNGAGYGDNCNFDGYTNSIYSVTVGAVDRAGLHPYYSEHCSAQLVVTYSSGSGDAIHTTDTGTNKCYGNHGGTSAAAPLAAGIFALILEIRPDLTWRDVQYLAMDTAAQVDDPEANWQETAIGKQFSHTFGYGKIDSYALVQKAKDWELVKPQSWLFSPWLQVRKEIPQGKHGLSVTFEVTEDMLKEANLERLEHVTVTMNVEHTRRGDISVDLISPEKVISHISVARPKDDFKGGYDMWTFMSVAHWGESGVGKWTLIVRDTVKNEHVGTFEDWHLKLWGEAKDAKKAKLLPMPEENDDADHDKPQSTISVPAVTTSAQSGEATEPSAPPGNPTDHHERPTKPARPSASSTGSSEAQEATETSSSHWVSWLPTFGASKKAQIWIYGAVGLILAFCIGLGAWLLIVRRRRLRNDPRTNYEFELLDDEETQGLNSGEKGVGGKKAKRTRGGELYDAFAEGSEDELEEYSDGPASGSGSGGRSREQLPGDQAGDQYVIGEESSDDDDDGREKSRLTSGRS
ncbi:hypothetical protein CC79DRAFT_1268269 [Sarocladium strictum]